MTHNADFTATERRGWRGALGQKNKRDEDAPPISGLRLLLRILISAVPDFALAAVFYITWNAPYTFGTHTVHHLVFVMLVEFLVVHATGFMGAISARGTGKWERIGMFSALSLFYVLMAAGFAASYQGIWPIVAMIYLLGSKIPNIMFRPTSDDAMMGVMANWAAMVCLYLFGCMYALTAGVESRGITPEVIAAQGFDVGGEFPEKPYIVMVFGAVYFTGMGILSILTELLQWAAARRRYKAG